MIRLLVVTLLLSGCASRYKQPDVTNPIRPVQIQCSLAPQLDLSLKTIIANPQYHYPDWHNVFVGVAGDSTPEQRYSSAKTVLWTLRTRCPGY